MQNPCKFKFLYYTCLIFNNNSKYILELHPLVGQDGHLKSYEKKCKCFVNYIKSITLFT
jgi:hypothetical protein